MIEELPDDKDRLLAVTTFDKNIVVTAGAGTGKTTLLVDRITHLLMRETGPLSITDIIAITFTKKAANEMKVRLRSRLQYFIDSADGNRGQGETGEKNNYEAALLRDLMQRYNLGMDVIAQRAVDAVNNLEKAQIGTIHSFAGHILRLYPLEAGITPDFVEDDGSGFEIHFEREWEEWLDVELSAGSKRGEAWKEVLRKVPIESIKIFAKCLCRETVPLSSPVCNHPNVPCHPELVSGSQTAPGEEIPKQVRDDRGGDNFRTWLEQEKRNAREILNRYEGGRKVKMQDLLRESITLFDNIIEGVKVSPFDDSIPQKAPTGWLENDYSEAARIVSAARSLSMTDEVFIGKLTGLILPFAISCRNSFVLSGKISFDGLLAFCCNILKNRRNIRSNLKNNFKSILVDEFQDTDPLQYEIILYLAEEQDRFEKDWREIKLAQGKVFIVGDPKQSIYAFRGADIEAYHKVVDMIMKQGGIIANLSTNFRSHNGIINVVNSVCRQIIRGRDYIQPEYVDITECPGREALKPLQRVELRLVDTRDEDDRDSADAVEREALAIGKFLKDEMIGKEIISDSDGGEMPVSPRHIAILLPKLTQVHEYLDVLKRLRIPYIVEGDRHFYGTQEVIDFVNLLRVLDNPLDKTAMAGVLRSPLGGISDRELYELCRLSLMDYRIDAGMLKQGLERLKHSGSDNKRQDEFKELIPALYNMMKRLYMNVSLLPVPDAIHYIFGNSPVLELAASSYHGEQCVANLLKIFRIAEGMSDKSNLTLKGLTALLEKRVASREKEGESLLSEEGIDAVRILSIHRAKGLEFPVVVVGGMQGIPNRGREPASVTYDWSGGMTGMSVAGLSNYPYVMMQDKQRLIEKEERKRLLYVAMTRAKECLILSGVLGKRTYKDSFLSMLTDTMGGSAGDSSADEIRVEEGILKQTVIDYKSCTILETPAREIRMSDERISREKIEALSGLWDKRYRNYKAILDRPFFVTPSSEEKKIAVIQGKMRRSENHKPVQAERAVLIGNIAHYVLSNWDFALDVSRFKAAVEDACRKFINPSHPISHPMCHPEFISGSQTMSGQEIPKQVRDDCKCKENTIISVQSELDGLFEKFSSSPAYEELKGAEILGKEVPFAIPWDGQVMEGVIDIIYRYGDKLYAADYKTDRISEGGIESKVNEYSVSADIYMNAVRMCTGSDIAGFKLIFLRHGKCIQCV